MSTKQENTKYISKDPIKELEVISHGHSHTHRKCACQRKCGCGIMCDCFRHANLLINNFPLTHYGNLEGYKMVYQKDPQSGNVYNLYTKDYKKVLSKISAIWKHEYKDYYYIICLDDKNVANTVILMKEDGILQPKLKDFSSFTYVLKNGNFIITTIEGKLIIVDDELNLIKRLDFTPMCYEHPDIYPVVDPTGHGTYYYNAHTGEIIDKISNAYFIYWIGNKAHEHKSEGANGTAPFWLQTREFIKKDDVNKIGLNCSICMLSIEKQTCLKPCGHAQFCSGCIEKIQKKPKSKCPICDEEIKESFRIYLT